MNPFDDPSFDAWSRSALADHLRRHPVDATFIGVHDHDHRLPDVSPDGLSETLDAMRSHLSAGDNTAAGDRDAGSSVAANGDRDALAGGSFGDLDRRLVRGFLASRIWEYESGHVSANPSVHVGDAVFGLMGPLLTRFGSMDERLEAVAARLAEIPRFFAGARELLESGDDAAMWRPGDEGGPVHGSAVPSAWTRRAIRECAAGVRFVEEGLEHVEGDGGPSAWPAALRSDAADAFRSFGHFLERDVLPSGSDDVACGPEAFEMYLRDGHFLTRSPDDIVAYARDEMVRTRSWLESAAPGYGAATPEELMAGLADLHPTADGYLNRYGDTWEAMRAVALDRDLVTWPDFPIEYVERPRWARAAAPDLYFLFYRSPSAFHRPDRHHYMVAPLDTSASDDDQRAFLRATNDSVIKLNHVVHHGGIGHHVQNWHAFRSPSLVGRIAAVDCASRIAMFCGGTMAEGWSCYATDLMAEAGGCTESEQFAAHAGRVRMCARAIVDVELHHGWMTLDEAAAFYEREAGMSPAAAEGEAVKNSMFPGAALMYLVGTDMIHELRRDLMGSLGDAFDLRSFHDALLSYGSVPVSLVADEMRRRAGARLPLGAHDEVTV
ncbi:MAG: DUF885 domain-containing protein [Acidimicrobiia bacterium]|nr:DUF885 domain-containing protein [Acidimicrobiia bacterium]